MYGWIGKLLRVDLSTQKIRAEKIPEKVLHQFIGGKGLGTYYLYKEVPAWINPLTAENRFYLATGPTQGTRIPITGRCSAISKSPLTQLYIDSNIGGYLGPELKRVGYDLLVVQGQAEKPVWIHITEDDLAIKDAKKYWGTTIHETEQALRKSDPKTQVISTGPAGEHLVRFACLTHNYFRNFGRGGLGAVFGAKKLKAIAIRGPNKKIATPDVEKEREMVIELAQRARNAKERGHSLHYRGTPWLVDYSNNIGMFPTRNFQTTNFESFEKIDDETIETEFREQKRRTPCEGCVISCAWTFKDPKFPWAPMEKTGKIAIPEYETLGLMGGNLGISDITAIIQLNHLCNTLGLDTISTGNVIGFLMELTQRKLLPNNLKSEAITFGETKNVIQLVSKIATRKGIGDNLAEGVRRFAKDIGAAAESLALHTKGLEYPAWDPRGKLGLGLSYATAAAGASHLRGWPSTTKPPETGAIPVLDSLIEQQNLKILKDSLIICHFTHSIAPRLEIEDCAKILNVVTGIKYTADSVNEVANRTWILARMFNIREFNEPARQYDKLPHRFMNEPIPDGPTKGYTAFISHQDFEESLTELYKRRGCNPEGHPTSTALKELELSSMVNG
ncbi:MAG: aldehyde ferredoxin oxidoreductase family protein [Candidatus Thorarchaeota archaeon]